MRGAHTRATILMSRLSNRRSMLTAAPDYNLLTLDSNGGIKKFLNNITHTLTANRYGGS